MRFKVDENLHPEVVGLLRQAGHDALSVGEQGLRGTDDANLAAVCGREGQALVTLDGGFGDIRTYPPDRSAGIVVLKLGSQSRRHVRQIVGRLLPVLSARPLSGHLWVVAEHDVRVRGGTEEPA